ncbi:MAG TPA: nucleotide sugar dehydrogenase [Candidatus Dormibacteraeota bacterium]|nr:nucleotide sugar dehydrogenase [Candidatus Dormibacteraeota bacterium]
MTGLDVVVVGGAGHVGLPLALCFVDAGCRVGIYDLDEGKLARIKAGEMPFKETGGEELLQRAIQSGRLDFSSTADMAGRSHTVVLVIGTPIDEFMNPSIRVFERVVDELAHQLRPSTLLILRSTVYPGTTEQVQRRLEQAGVDADVVFCPERVAEGNAVTEIRSLPQIIGASTDSAFERARNLFARLDVEIIRTTPKEAELAKLLTNTWRYMRFAIANQFFEIAHRAGIDYGNVLHAIRYNYPRAADLAGPGLAAGPCLLKDTMQLAAFTADRFPIGHAAMLINEGLPNYIIDTLEGRRPLSGRVVGILGMAFKGESDDSRTSLSYKLKKLAAFKGARVLCTDPYVRDPDLLPLDHVVEQSDILIVAAPHRAYHALPVDGQEVVDIWGVLGRGIVL